MDPIFWIIVLGVLLKEPTKDLPYLFRGGTPPSHVERMQRRTEREAARQRRHEKQVARAARPRGKGREYVAALKDHAFEQALQRRQVKWQEKTEKLGPVRGERYAARYQRVADRAQARLDGTYRGPIRRAVDHGRALHARAAQTARSAVTRKNDAAEADSPAPAEQPSVGDAAPEGPADTHADAAAAPTVTHDNTAAAPTGRGTTTGVDEHGRRFESTGYPDDNQVAMYPDNLAAVAATDRGWRDAGDTALGTEYRRESDDGAQLGVRPHEGGGYEWIARRGSSVEQGVAPNLSEAFDRAETAEQEQSGRRPDDDGDGQASDDGEGSESSDGDCPPGCDWCAAEATQEAQARDASGAQQSDSEVHAHPVENTDTGGATTNGTTSNPERSTTMTTVPSEVTGVDEAIAAVDAWKNEAAGGVPSLEELRASLQSQGVGQNALNRCARVQELYDQMLTEITGLRDDLQQSVNVGETYDANPEAGNTAFVTNGARQN